jgi:hypothetical protein
MANADHSPTPSSAAPHEGGPVWLTLAYRYGFPAAVAAFLIYFLTQVVAADVKAVREGQAQIKADHYELKTVLEHANRRQEQQLFGLCMVVADGDPISERWCKVGQ